MRAFSADSLGAIFRIWEACRNEYVPENKPNSRWICTISSSGWPFLKREFR
jgi:hypothetical protein